MTILVICVLFACDRAPTPIGLPALESDNPNAPRQSLPNFGPVPQELSEARPSVVMVDPDAIYVNMEDGTQCLGAAGADFRAAGWSGVLGECRYEYAYSVELSAGAVAKRYLLQPVAQDSLPAPEDAPKFRPIVSVTIINSSGERFRFESIEGF